MIANQLNTPPDLENWLRLKTELSASDATAASTRQAIDAFCRFADGMELTFDSINDRLLGEWVSQLLFDGYSLKTVTFYLRRLSAVYSKAVEEGLAQPTDAFSSLRLRLSAPGASRFEGDADKEAFGRFHKLICNDCSAVEHRQMAKDMLLLSIYRGGLSVADIVNFRKDEYKGADPKIQAIVNRWLRAKNKYLFPLDHSKKNSSQLCREAELMMEDMLKSQGIAASPVKGETCLYLWCAIAAASGISRSDISACVAPKSGISAVTAFVTPSEIAEAEKERIREMVATAVADNPLHWYAMRLRRRVSYEMLTRRLEDKKITLGDVYYPMQDILHIVGSRKVFETRPVVSWLLFFRAHASELNRLYHHIGDLAWGYRQSRHPGSPYAIISPREIYSYQTAIGSFTASTQLLPEGSTELKPGDRLVIIGGLFNGRPATYESTVPGTSGEADGKVVYRLLLDGGKCSEWVVREDARLVKKISEEQFDELRALNLEESW